MRLVLVALALALPLACDGDKDPASSDSGGAKKTSPAGVSSAEAIPGLLAEATEIAEKTWPGAKVGGIRIGEEVPPGGRANAYAVRVSFEFESDPTDPSTKSGSVICSPECSISRAKVKRAAAPPPPCSFAEAFAAAKAAGFTGERPIVGYGFWNLDGRKGWTFRTKRDGPAVEVGEGCVAKADGAG